MNKEHNYAFIDGQNLYMNTHQNGWKIDYQRLYIYLKDKYSIQHVFYFFGYYSIKQEKLYKKLSTIGYILIFKKHHQNLLSNKKGNIDSDIIFEIMKKMISNQNFSKILLVSGDGDYLKTVYYLIHKNKFKKILFPSRNYSSLYKKLKIEYKDNISNLRNYIQEKDPSKN